MRRKLAALFLMALAAILPSAGCERLGLFQEPKTVWVAVAARNMGQNERLSEDKVIFEPVPANSYWPSGLLQKEELGGYVGSSAQEPLKKGAPIFKSALYWGSTACRGLAENKRGMILPTEQIAGLLPGLRSGDSLDIVVTYAEPIAASDVALPGWESRPSGEPMRVCVVKDVRGVWNFGSGVIDNPREGVSWDNPTIALSPEGALALSLALDQKSPSQPFVFLVHPRPESEKAALP